MTNYIRSTSYETSTICYHGVYPIRFDADINKNECVKHCSTSGFLQRYPKGKTRHPFAWHQVTKSCRRGDWDNTGCGFCGTPSAQEWYGTNNDVVVTLLVVQCGYSPWWRHHMETFSALLALCAGNSPVTGDFPTQRPVMRNFGVWGPDLWQV